MEHLLFIPPFLWEERLRSISLGQYEVGWLLAVPISEKEMQFAENQGLPALEQILESNNVDILDLERTSVV